MPPGGHRIELRGNTPRLKIPKKVDVERVFALFRYFWRITVNPVALSTMEKVRLAASKAILQANRVHLSQRATKEFPSKAQSYAKAS